MYDFYRTFSLYKCVVFVVAEVFFNSLQEFVVDVYKKCSKIRSEKKFCFFWNVVNN